MEVYYDPDTGLYADAVPVSTVFDNADSPIHIDRNGLLCYNPLALAGTPYTAHTTVELESDLSYNPGQTWWEKLCKKISKWWNGLSKSDKICVGLLLVLASVVLAFATSGVSFGAGAGLLGSVTVATALSIAAKAALIDLAIGIGFAIAGWALNAANTGDWSMATFENDMADAIFFTGLFMFVSSSIGALKYAYRSDPYPTPTVDPNAKIKNMSYDDMLPNEKAAYDGYSKHGWKGNYPSQAKGVSAGKLFKNEPAILPNGIYHEFDINPVVQGIGRDASRFVVSERYVVYLTRDHYATFFRIRP